MNNSERVQSWRKRAKQKLVEIAGGECCVCGYNRCITALEFHHIDASKKEFAVTGSRNTRALSLMIAEIRKCVLVCANCHREIHQNMIHGNLLVTNQQINESLVDQFIADSERARNDSKFQPNKVKPRCRKVDWTVHNVTILVKEHGSYEAVGRLLGVTGAAVKRQFVKVQKTMPL